VGYKLYTIGLELLNTMKHPTGSPGSKPQMGTATVPKAKVSRPPIERELNEINKCLRLAWSKTQPEQSSALAKTRAFA